jgi:protein disulfide-isomerase A1
MQFYTVLLALAVLAVSCLSQELEEGVLVLTDENFEKTISDNEFILVEFYAPWCGHCKSLAPEYAKAAQQLAKDDSAVKLAKLDATEHKTAASKHDVKGFPTLKFFRSGNAAEYGGGRTADEIVSWLSKKTGPVATPITSAEEYSHMEEANDVFVLGAFADTSSAAAKTFLDVAASMEPHTFAITDNADVKSSLGVSADTVVIVKTFDERRNDLEISNSANKQDIIDFVGGHAIPLVQVFSDETSGKIFKSPIQKHTLFFTDSESDHHEGVTEAFRTAGKDFRGRTMMVNVQESQSRVAEYFGLKTSDFPAAIFADMSSSGGMKKYPMTGDISDPANIKSFLEDAFAGKLQPTLKSETPEAADTEGAVTVVKGKSFQELVLDNTKDVLMEFYAPWCGHCKALAPEYEKLGESLKGNDNIVVGKMDSTANEIDVAGVEVKGFPTLYFFKGNSKGSPMKYEGGRTFEDMAEYIQKNAFNEVGEIDTAEDDEDDEDDENDEL